MKKLIIALIVVVWGCTLFPKRTPETVLKSVFGISLKGFDYSVETFEEQWCPNGDGQALIIYKFNKIAQENIDYLKTFHVKRLPITKEDHIFMTFNEIPEEYFNLDVGYYIYGLLSPLSIEKHTDYKVFVIDTVNKKAILYYQRM